MGNCNYTPVNEDGCNKTTPVRPMPCMQSRSCNSASDMRSRSRDNASDMRLRSRDNASDMRSRSCNRTSDPLANLPVGMAYVPWQFFQEVYEPDKAIQCGTIFPELNKPFFGKGGCPR